MDRCDIVVVSAAQDNVSPAQECLLCLPGLVFRPHCCWASHWKPTVMCIMTRPVNGQTLRAAYCLQLLITDSGIAATAAEAQEGTVPAG